MDCDTIALGELTEMWLRESRGVVNADTLALYRLQMQQHVLPWFGDETDIPEERVRAYVGEKIAEGLAERTVFMQQRMLHRVLEYGASLGYCRAPEWDSVMDSPQRKRGIVILTPEEEARLTRYLVDHPGGKNLCIFLMLTAGLQTGEALALQWKDVSVKLGCLRVRSERGPVTDRRRRIREVPVGERQKLYLRKLAGPGEHYLASGTPRPMSRAMLETHLRNILSAQLLPSLTPTCLRHTYAVRRIEAGMDYETLSRQLGLQNDGTFRRKYRELVSGDHRERLERERLEGRKVRQAPERITPPEQDPAVTDLQRKIEARKKELQATLDCLEGDLAIFRTLRNADGVQGQAREGLYRFVGKVLGDDRDGQVLVEYLRSNMRVAAMPSCINGDLTVQAIRRRVSHGFAKLCDRLDEINAVEGWDSVGTLTALCDAVIATAPPEPARTGPKPKPTLQNRCKKAFEALARTGERLQDLQAQVEA